MRGEHLNNATLVNRCGGSSPHARGARRIASLDPPPAGIIPACAGSTSTPKPTTPRLRDHPRMRGEHLVGRGGGAEFEGLSPHARGAPATTCCAWWSPGIIPACAGSTRHRLSHRAKYRDHPRMRGEHRATPAKPPSVAGSSPHARGALPQRQVRHGVRGIIPACAGSTGSTP